MEGKCMGLDKKTALNATKLALEFNRQPTDVLNNKLVDIKEKYGVTDYDWLTINVALNVLTTREVVARLK